MRKLTDTSAEVEGLRGIIQKLQAQLSSNNSKNNNTTKSNEASLAALLAEKEAWKEKIDKIYTDLRIAGENFFSMSSKEKLLQLRTKFKETLEQNRKLFNMNGEFLKRVCIMQIIGHCKKKQSIGEERFLDAEKFLYLLLFLDFA